MKNSQFPQRTAPGNPALSLLKCNAVTARYGLRLTEADAKALSETQGRVLKASGRVAFAGGILNELVLVFCDSPYIGQDSWADTLAELTEAFYVFKNESLDEIDDAEAIALMKRLFDGDWCEGSLDRLREELLPMAARRIRAGLPPEPEEDGTDEPEDVYDE
jgi:hypothetical protein